MSERQRELSDIRELMDTARGRRIMWRILEGGRVFASTFSPEPLNMAAMEGARSLALRFLADVMETAPKKFQVMLLEAKEAREFEERLREREEREQDE